MKISISRDAILNPLQMVNSVIERRQTLPILSNVLMSVKESSLSLTGTDLEVEVINSCEMLVCTSRVETLHLSGVEASACNLPLVTSDVGIYFNLENLYMF